MNVDLLDPDLYAGDPEPVYAWLRQHAPVYRDDVNNLWGVSRHRDVHDIECHPQQWTSATGSRPGLPAQPSMIDRDDPEHLTRRRLVYRRFTPRGVLAHEPQIAAYAKELVDNIVANDGVVDGVTDVAAPLPARVIGLLLGFDDAMWPALQHWATTTIPAGGGPRAVTEEAMIAAAEYSDAVLALAAERRRQPREDLMSVWVEAGLDDDDLTGEAILLLDGGAETTRTVIATTLDALAQHPDQWQLLRREPERVPVAVEEFIRWTSPILNMARSAVHDCELHDVHINAGDEVLLMYPAANRDERVFERPEVFDVTRQPNPHLAFGVGAHFCLGAALARLELRMLFSELVSRFDGVEWGDDVGPRRMPNAFVRGILEFPVRFVG